MRNILDIQNSISFWGIAKDISVCFLLTVLLLVFCISSSALIFSGYIGNHLIIGLGMILVSAIVTSLFLSFSGSFPQVFVSPQDTFVIILAVSLTAITTQLKSLGLEEQVVPTITAAIIISTISVGIILYLIGVFELGNYARFIPYQVLGGFFAGTGMLIISHSWIVFTGDEFKLADVPDYLSYHMLMLWVPAVSLGVVLYVIEKFFKKPLYLPPITITSLIAFYLILYHFGETLDTALNNGYCLGPFYRDNIWNFPSISLFTQVNWDVLKSQLGNLVSMMVLAPIAILLNITVIESETKADIELDNELKRIGISSIFSPALGGGGLLNHGMIETVLNFRFGTKSRLAGIVIAVCFTTLLILGLDFLTYFPRFLVGGIVLYVGLDLVFKWLFESRKSYTLLEYCVILMIAAVILIEGFIQGLILGFIVSLFVFVFNYSKMNVIKRHHLGSYFHSNVERGEFSRHILQKHGDVVHILSLQGYLFFGNAQKILKYVADILSDHNKAKMEYLIVDFIAVKGVDSTSIYSFTKLVHFCINNQVNLIFTGLHMEIKDHLIKHMQVEGISEKVYFFTTTDYALEWCENKLLEQEKLKVPLIKSPVLRLKQIIADAGQSGEKSIYFERMEVEKRFEIIAQGSDAVDLYFLESGFVDVVMQTSDRKYIRLRSIGPGTIFGELGLYLNIPRSASIVATEKCVLYKITEENIERLQKENPKLALQFQEIILSQLASRLVYSNHQVEGMMRS